MNYLIDIDGTLLNGSEPIIGAIDFINSLNKNKANYLLIATIGVSILSDSTLIPTCDNRAF